MKPNSYGTSNPAVVKAVRKNKTKKKITEDSVFYTPKKGSKRAPILSPSSVSNFPQIFKRK